MDFPSSVLPQRRPQAMTLNLASVQKGDFLPVVEPLLRQPGAVVLGDAWIVFMVLLSAFKVAQVCWGDGDHMVARWIIRTAWVGLGCGFFATEGTATNPIPWPLPQQAREGVTR